MCLRFAQFSGLWFIRNMEPAWEKITGRNFALSTYKDPTGRTLPWYLLTKTECLYIATKFILPALMPPSTKIIMQARFFHA
ncbi:MAG: hypothetical protein J5671_03290 [Bacteroidaceae bacterium]|nr:hypothetical protein [Bacteroidaceae bacterium]